MKKRVESEALRFSAGEITINEIQGAENGATEYEVSLLARSSGAIEHWYWGQQTIHDLDGMEVAHKIPIDFNHDPGEVIGYLDRFTSEPDGLRVEGKLISFSQDDRAADIARRAKAGIPWQASINFGGDGITVESVPDGEEVFVNNRQFSGPATVIRTFPLRGVAITPYGADANTESVVLSNQGSSYQVDFKETKMSDEQQDVAVEEPAVEAEVQEQVEEVVAEDAAVAEVEENEVVEAEEQAAPADAQLSQADGKRYVELFGQQGALWFVEGKSINECFSLHIANLEEENKSLKDENVQLKNIDRGEDAPLSFSNSTDMDDEKSELARRAKELKAAGVGSEFIAVHAARIEQQLNR